MGVRVVRVEYWKSFEKDKGLTIIFFFSSFYASDSIIVNIWVNNTKYMPYVINYMMTY